jgi:L-amino acid N-acyltransferase YncA
MTVSKTIRLASPDDSVAMAGIYEPYVRNTAVSFEYDPPTAEVFRERIAGVVPKYPWLVFEIDGRIAGYSYASRYSERPAYQWSVDSTVYIHPGFQRRKIASSLYYALFELLKLQGYYNVYAAVTSSNLQSECFHRSFGFEPVGTYRNVGYKLDRWHDVTWWQLRLAEHPPVPAAPGTIAEIAATLGFAAIIEKAAAIIR